MMKSRTPWWTNLKLAPMKVSLRRLPSKFRSIGRFSCDSSPAALAARRLVGMDGQGSGKLGHSQDAGQFFWGWRKSGRPSVLNHRHADTEKGKTQQAWTG